MLIHIFCNGYTVVSRYLLGNWFQDHHLLMLQFSSVQSLSRV